LASFVHVSTAYSNSEVKQIEEKVYPVNHDPRDLLASLEWMTPVMWESLKPKLLGEKVNA
jgi:alcohol-forming fatty acyl-CoA reductase